MQALSNGYYLLFFPVLIGLWLAWFALSRAFARRLMVIIGAWIVASLPLVPLLWGYRRIHAAFNFQRGAGEIGVFGADVSSLLDASPLLRFWRLEKFHQPEGELFPGFTAIALVVLLLIHWLWTSKPESRVPRTCVVLLLGAVTFIGIALSALLVGPWAITMGGSTLLSVRVVSKPLSIGVLLFILALALEPRIVGAWRRRSPLLFYVLATAAMYLLCFGPRPRFLGEPFIYRAPYSWLMSLPGYDAVRVPARFAMLAALCLSVVAALAFARLTRRGRWFIRAPLAAMVAAGVLVDSWIGEMPLPKVPFRLQALESLPERDGGDGAAARRHQRRRGGDVPRHVSPRPAGQRLQRVFSAKLRGAASRAGAPRPADVRRARRVRTGRRRRRCAWRRWVAMVEAAGGAARDGRSSARNRGSACIR